MFVSELKVYQFRNLDDVTIRLPNGPIALVGRNGNGKTNIVESLSFLSQGRSFRTTHIAELISEGKKEASVFGKIVGPDDEVDLGVLIESRKRAGFVNGDRVSSFSEYAGRLVCITFDPSDLELIQGGPALRRNFIDRHLVDVKPGILRPMMQYQRALASKNALLRTENVRVDDLSPWNHILAETGAVVAVEREKFVRALEERANVNHFEYAPGDGKISLEWESSFDGEVGLTEGSFFDAFERAGVREVSARTARFGPHRDELKIQLGNRSARSFASQGQCRSLVLSMKFGVIELVEEKIGQNAVVLLDDVDSELDPERSRKLFSVLFNKERQLLVTGTREPKSDGSFAAVFEVERGAIKERHL